MFDPPFGEGAYGKVWLVRNAIGQWQALKVIYLANFDNNVGPFDREFNGISRYKPISDKHPGLLRLDFVSRKREGYFYYVMELERAGAGVGARAGHLQAARPDECARPGAEQAVAGA